MIHKKVAPVAHQIMLNYTAKPHYINNAFDVCNAKGHLSGKRLTTEFCAGSIGSNYGLPKVTALDNYAHCQDTALSSLNVSKITGSNKYPKNILNTIRLNTLSMMPHIFIRTAAC